MTVLEEARAWGRGLLWALPGILLVLVLVCVEGWPAVACVWLLGAYVSFLIVVGVRLAWSVWRESDDEL